MIRSIRMEKQDTPNNRFWEAKVENHNLTSAVLTSHGVIGGKPIHRVTEVKGKNIGKSNESSPEEQAVRELLSKARKKRDKNYTVVTSGLDLKALDLLPVQTIKPMLATTFTDKSLLGQTHIMVQPKLDGIRCLASLDSANQIQLQSRGGKFFDTLDHIKTALTPIFLKNPEIICDGEIYIHGIGFQDLVSAVKKKREMTAILEFHIYDVVNHLPFHQRLAQMDNLIEDSFLIKKVHTATVKVGESLQNEFNGHIRLGYEGSIVRTMEGIYRLDKRSKDLLKVKQFQDSEYRIVGGKKEPLPNGRAGVVYRVCDLSDSSKEFSVRPVGNMAVREQALLSLPKNIGELLTVRFQSLTDDGLPRFGVGLTIRNYE